ncbi:hypothetical protein TRFO_20810 [Tritrichomonas foetus]|uniref:Uncharacterized protein n=1 Tax=Tritrichomonas foetus TaxID=1144522 RepID=A0A1J4KFS2_9EUKA|nr:hypothetical protein TRFO_20810 [Tritrichomonas foetus]|eukprot:OHT10075.1 hypothetical protein TRFO_20810 [Tritrichomonas foetus]
MGIAYVKINQISGLKMNKKSVAEAEISFGDEAIQPTLLKGNENFTCDDIWSLPFDASIIHKNNANNELISIKVIKNKSGKRSEKARLALPLHWFPLNFIVREKFPMRNLVVSKSRHIVADISLHLSTNGCDPFTAPIGKMLVKPACDPIAPPGKTNSNYPGSFRVPPQNQVQQILPPQQNVIVLPPPHGIPQIIAGPAPQIFSNPLPPRYSNYPQFPSNRSDQPNNKELHNFTDYCRNDDENMITYLYSNTRGYYIQEKAKSKEMKKIKMERKKIRKLKRKRMKKTKRTEKIIFRLMISLQLICNL